MMTLVCPECRTQTWYIRQGALEVRKVECTECGHTECL